MFLVCWQLFLLPTVTLGVDCALELFCRHDKAFPWIRDQRRNQIRQYLQSSRARPAVFIKFCAWTETYKEKKLIFRSSMKFSFQRIQDQWIWRPVQGDMAKTLDAERSEIRNRLQCWDKMDITLLFGINFGRIRTRWKEKFVYFAMEQCFSTGSILEIERKIREDEATMGQRGIFFW